MSVGGQEILLRFSTHNFRGGCKGTELDSIGFRDNKIRKSIEKHSLQYE